MRQALLLSILFASVAFGQECSVNLTRRRVKEKMDKLATLVTNLLCGVEESKKGKKVKPSLEPTLKVFFLRFTMTYSYIDHQNLDEMCGKLFSPKPGNRKMLHCFVIAQHLDLKNITDAMVGPDGPNLCTHAELMGFFSVTPEHKIQLTWNPKDFENLINLLESKQVAVILSLSDLDKFDPFMYSKIARSEEKRNNFTASLMEVIDEYDLDGFLAHWEYPVLPYNDNLRGFFREDARNFPTLIQLLSNLLKKRNLVLYSFGPCFPFTLTHYNFHNLTTVVDLWFMSTYHFEASSHTSIKSPISGLEGCIKLYARFKVPPEKMVIGIASFNTPVVLQYKKSSKIGAILNLKAAQNHECDTFRGLCYAVRKAGLEVVHNESKVAYSYAFKDADWVSFDSSKVIKRKMEIVKEWNLAGAFFNAIGHDDVDGKACNCGKFHLLRSMNEYLRGDGTCEPPLCP